MHEVLSTTKQNEITQLHRQNTHLPHFRSSRIFRIFSIDSCKFFESIKLSSIKKIRSSLSFKVFNSNAPGLDRERTVAIIIDPFECKYFAISNPIPESQPVIRITLSTGVNHCVGKNRAAKKLQDKAKKLINKSKKLSQK